MAKHEIVMPQMGESITNGTIVKWHKQAGDEVEIDEILLEISTDKVESEIPCAVAGRVEEIKFPEGETVDVGVVIAIVEDDLSAPVTGPNADTKNPTPAETETAQAKDAERGGAETPSSGERRKFYTPLVRALAKEHGVPLSELDSLQGSGAGGRVNKDDFLNYVKTRKQGVTAPAVSAATPSSPSPAPSSAPGASGTVEIVSMSSLRKTIARNMVASKQISPHVNSIDTVDMTALVKFRESVKNDFKRQEGFALTYTHFVLYTLVQALKEFPYVNASIDGDNIVLKKDINLGCAVAIPDSGLVVPVIKKADGLNLTGLARELHVLVEKARAKKLEMSDLEGGTYTFTNNGSFGVLAATPIILQPQLGIFCVGAIRKTPVVTSDHAIAIRDIMYATHTYDHRLIDGEMGSRFLKHVVQALENMEPSRLL